MDLTDLSKIQTFLETEWSMVSSAPFAFIAAVLILSLLIGFVLRIFYKQTSQSEMNALRSQIGNKDSHIALLRDEKDGLQEQREVLKKLLDEHAPKLQIDAILMRYGPESIREVLLDLADKGKLELPVSLLGSVYQAKPDTDVSEKDIERAANVRILIGSGLADPGGDDFTAVASASTSTVASTMESIDFRTQLFDPERSVGRLYIQKGSDENDNNMD